jgi:Kdo2-lipid IVA lauroyltransferase/acyltransferase
MGKKIKNTIIYWLARSMMGLVRLMSFSRSQRFGRWLGRRAFRWAKQERLKTLAHLQNAFPGHDEGEREKLALSVFEHFGMAAAEVINAGKIKNLTYWMELDSESRRVLDDVLARGRGVVYVTAHCGNWELMARCLAQLGYPINTIGKQSYDHRFTRLIQRFRDEGAVNTIWRGDPDIIEKMVKVVRKGEIMGFLNDQDTNVPGVFVEFFGKEAHTPNAAAVLLRKTGASVVTGFNFRLPKGGYRIEIQEFEPSTHEDFEQAVKEDTQRLTRQIEEHIRRHASEWVWMHRRWKTRPKAR